MLVFTDQSSLWPFSLSGVLVNADELTVMRHGSLFVNDFSADTEVCDSLPPILYQGSLDETA